MDSGKTWTLVARVHKAASSPADGAMGDIPAVERGGRDGVAFGIGGRRMIRILPDLPANYKNNSAIVVGMGRGTGLFNELIPAAGATVRQILNNRPVELRADYVPQDRDLLLITSPQSAPPVDRVADAVKLLGERYRESIAARLKAEGKKPTTGMLTVTVNLAPGDRAGAITYFLDGEVLAIQNAAPYVLKVDTRRWANGEHVLEARAVDISGAILTQKKTLLYVENGP